MATYILLIDDTYNIKEIEEHLKTSFISYDYMLGFLDGYLFDKYTIKTPREYEKLHNSLAQSVKNKHIKFLYATDKAID